MIMIDFEFKPWLKYPDLTEERLRIIAEIIRSSRDETVRLHDPLGGDDAWSLGCRAYSRICYALRQACEKHNWIGILTESEKLRFTFSVGSVPVRFYSGPSDDPPGRYLHQTYGELHHQQLFLELDGVAPIGSLLRIAVESDGGGRVEDIFLVEVDEEGNVTQRYCVPDVAAANVLPMQTKPISLPPVSVEPLEQKSTQQSVERTKNDEEHNVG